jgi:hypothetical protein
MDLLLETIELGRVTCEHCNRQFFIVNNVPITLYARVLYPTCASVQKTTDLRGYALSSISSP